MGQIGHYELVPGFGALTSSSVSLIFRISPAFPGRSGVSHNYNNLAASI